MFWPLALSNMRMTEQTLFDFPFQMHCSELAKRVRAMTNRTFNVVAAVVVHAGCMSEGFCTSVNRVLNIFFLFANQNQEQKTDLSCDLIMKGIFYRQFNESENERSRFVTQLRTHTQCNHA